MRHMLVSSVTDAESCAQWTNQMQALAEEAPFGVPMNISSDPRHGVDATAEFNSGAGGDISHWPGSIGMAATFDTELMERYGEIVAKEYRAMGITTALSPQIDLSTEPRWGRFSGSFGESSAMCRDMGQAYCDGLQESSGEQEVEDGWGRESIVAMAKHWPGGGAVEAGRDAHFPCGKYSVYPGNNFEEHLIPFTEGALKLKGKTGKAGAIMPYYTIPTGQDAENGENVGCSYNKYLITTLLREKYGYDELVCTDWGITDDEGPVGMALGGKCWGVEHLTQAERCYKILMAGVDQFGGLMKKEPVLEAYRMGVKEHGEEWMQERMRRSAVRILRNIFRLGLFENPYAAPQECKEIVGNAAYCEVGFQAQTQSVVLLKNQNQVLPLEKKAKVYIPKQYTPARRNWMMQQEPERWTDPAGEWISGYFERVETPEEADAAICFMRMPKVGNGMMGMDNGYQNGEYVPISRQYRPYTAEFAREVSLAGGDPQETSANRSYKGKTVTTFNECDLDMVLELREKMGTKPVIATPHEG